VLLVESETAAGAASGLAEDLREAGHEVRPRGAASGDAAPWKPDVLLVRLESDSAAVLDAVDRIAGERSFVGAQLLFTGGNELALTAARRRFPDASFARLDNVATALASIEANE
jgi:hypothetical protein